jgi:hypothetical protein
VFACNKEASFYSVRIVYKECQIHYVQYMLGAFVHGALLQYVRSFFMEHMKLFFQQAKQPYVAGVF